MSVVDFRHKKIQVNCLLFRDLHLLNIIFQIVLSFFAKDFTVDLFHPVILCFLSVLLLSSHSLPFLVIFALERHYLKRTITSFQGASLPVFVSNSKTVHLDLQDFYSLAETEY